MLGQGIFAGKKTYITGIMAIVGTLATYFSGDTLAIADAAQLILTAILGMTIRSGIKTDTQ